MSDNSSTERVVATAIADLHARIADLREDVEAGQALVIAPGRLAYARALASVITKLTTRREASFPTLTEGAQRACNELADIEVAIRANARV
jgi:hypothetical protein